jgi:hypothetical protein
MCKYRILIHKLFLINKIIKHHDAAFLLKKDLIRLRFHKILLINDDTDVIDYIFEYVSRVTSFHHIKFNGLPYYETKNLWRPHDIKERASYDIDVLCNKSRQCDREPSIIPKYGDKIKYVLKYNYRKKNILSKGDVKYNNFVLQISQYELRNVLLIGFDKFTVKTVFGYLNDDHRGSDHCNVYLPTHHKVRMIKYVTLYDLATAYYKLKSHKWDDYYEMFRCATTRIYNGNVNVVLRFDYIL